MSLFLVYVASLGLVLARSELHIRSNVSQQPLPLVPFLVGPNSFRYRYDIGGFSFLYFLLTLCNKEAADLSTYTSKKTRVTSCQLKQ